MSWSTFIKAHWGAIAATDLFTVEVVNPFGLVRYYLLFVIDIATRWVLPPSSVGEMTLRRYGALSYSQNSARDLRCSLNLFLGPSFISHPAAGG